MRSEKVKQLDVEKKELNEEKKGYFEKISKEIQVEFHLDLIKDVSSQLTSVQTQLTNLSDSRKKIISAIKSSVEVQNYNTEGQRGSMEGEGLGFSAPNSSGEGTLDETTCDNWFANWKKAFQGEFHDAGDSRGRTNLSNLNYLARSCLFLSISTSESLHTHEIQRPMFNYLSIIQSSGTGKSRLLRELGKSLPVVYANLNPVDATGYPFPNKRLRDYLLLGSVYGGRSGKKTSFSELPTIDERECERRCEILLLVVVISYYILFSSVPNAKAVCKVRLPTHKLNSSSSGESVADVWKTIGIKNHRSVVAIDFWDIIIIVCDKLSRTNATMHGEHDDVDEEEELCNVIKYLNKAGLSIFESSSNYQDEHAPIAKRKISSSMAQESNVEELLASKIINYTEISTGKHLNSSDVVERLKTVASKVKVKLLEATQDPVKVKQQEATQDPSSLMEVGLPAVVISLDEARDLTNH